MNRRRFFQGLAGASATGALAVASEALPATPAEAKVPVDRTVWADYDKPGAVRFHRMKSTIKPAAGWRQHHVISQWEVETYDVINTLHLQCRDGITLHLKQVKGPDIIIAGMVVGIDRVLAPRLLPHSGLHERPTLTVHIMPSHPIGWTVAV